MKKVISIVLTLILIKTQMFAIFGMGDIVSDPTSYTYYMKQIKAMNDQMEGVLKQIEKLNELNKLTEKANDLLTNTGEKIFNPKKRIMGIANDLQSSIKRMQSLGERVKNMGAERFMKEYHNIDEPLNNDDFQKWQKEFEKLFISEDDETYNNLQKEIQKAVKSGNYKKYERAVANMNTYLKIKGIEKDKLRRYALLAPTAIYNERFMSEAGKQRSDERFKKIEKYALQIESQKDMLKQQQTTNEILLLLLETVDEQHDLQMHFFNAISLAALSEKEQEQAKVDPESLKNTKEKLKNGTSSFATFKSEEEKKKNKKKFLQDLYQKADQDPNYKKLNKW
ncbi:hypothetical protein [Sulfurospirillum arcachonense]|uniref:hypothetical protein n=1 Tax=Sulfurospirillum arcachonense TaxID=57666 RepID=UPI0004683C93|nr:hypothetical protein [Sulfurospirillum arcachonense]